MTPVIFKQMPGEITATSVPKTMHLMLRWFKIGEERLRFIKQLVNHLEETQ